jgi:hypothetical protein
VAIVRRGLLRLGATAIVMKRSLFFVGLCVLPVISCKGKLDGASSSSGEPSASASAAASAAAAYDGPSGIVRGVVRITGDEPPELPGAGEIPVGKCFKAHERHRLLFRKAADGGVADALVAVTDYKAIVPKATAPVVVVAEDCSFTQRTVALNIGQSIHVKNRGPSAAMPQLIGLPTPAVMAAVPGGDPIVLTPHALGRFELIDRSHPYANAEVFVVNYPTTTVTGERGTFEIAGIPAGDVKVSVLLPATGLRLEQRATVEVGKAVDLNFELQFELSKYQAALELGRREEQGETVPPATATAPGASK